MGFCSRNYMLMKCSIDFCNQICIQDSVKQEEGPNYKKLSISSPERLGQIYIEFLTSIKVVFILKLD